MLIISVMLIVFWVGCASCESHDRVKREIDCDCDYHSGGCVISLAAPSGFKCSCSYKGFYTCSGTPYPCVGTEKCPGGEADYCSCQLGGGDCDGYRNPNKDCGGARSKRNSVAPDSAECDCNYHPGGCSISRATPYGWKCVCRYKGGWTCGGWAQRCHANEICLGGDYSYCGCTQGGGDCDAYKDKPSCPATTVSSTCNCDTARDWNSGFYNVESVSYDTGNRQIHSHQPIGLGEKDIPNYSSSEQSIELKFAETVTLTSSFSRTSGIEIQAGVTFSAGIPLLGQGEASISVTTSYEHTYGQEKSIAKTFEGSFTCNGAPKKVTKCSVSLQKAQVDVPYTMTLRHKIIPNCACQSRGIWRGVQAYNAHLTARETGDLKK